MATRKKSSGARSRPRRPRATAAPRSKARKPAARRAAAPKRPQRQDPETLRLRTVEPSLTVDDLEKSRRFYVDVLGFVEGEKWVEGGQLRGLMLKAGACQIGLSQDDWAKGRGREKGVGLSLWFTTAQDVDALAGRIKAAGGRLAQEPADAMGGRSLMVEDPDGFRIRIFRQG